MPIHDQSYRRYAGQRAPLGRSWTVIAKAGIANMLGKRLFIVLLLASWVPFIVHAVLVYFAANYPQTAAWFAVNAKMFRDFLDWQNMFVFVMTVYVGAGLIANDRRANALQIYLSKPLLRAEYIVGKAAILFTFVMFVTFVPAMLLVFLHVMFSASVTLLTNHPDVIPAITAATILESLLVTFTMLALSSLSKSARYVGILFAGIMFFTGAIYGVLYLITGSSSVSWISPNTSLSQVMDVIFRQTPRFDTPWQVSLLVVLGLIALSISVLERRVRGVEIVT
jgi:hypothetical protein